MAKENRYLNLLKRLDAKHNGGGVVIEPEAEVAREIVGDMDTFREETRQNRGEVLTSDEA